MLGTFMLIAAFLPGQVPGDISPQVIEVPINTPAARYRLGCTATFSSSGMVLDRVPSDSSLAKMYRPGINDAYYVAEAGDAIIAIRHADGRWIAPQSPKAFAHIVNSLPGRKAQLLLRDKNGAGNSIYTVTMLDAVADGGEAPPKPPPPPRRDDLSEARFVVVVAAQTGDATIGKAATETVELCKLLKDEPSVKSFKPIYVPLFGANYSRDSILNAIRDLQVWPNDALLCFINGHGAHDARLNDYCKGHYFQVPGQSLRRSDVRKALEEKNARLTCLISDSCNVPCPIPNLNLFVTKTTVENKKFESLFFQSRGFVDLNSSEEGQYSWTGVFVPVFFNALSEDPKRFNGPGYRRTIPADQATTWSEFTSELANSTQEWYSFCRTRSIQNDQVPAKTREMLRGQERQTLRVFELPK